MSEENENNDGTWSGLKKTIVGLITTAVTAGAAYFTSTLFKGGDESEAKTEVVVPAPAPVINLNVDNSSQNNASGGGTHTIIREVEKPAAQPAPAKPKEEETLW
jgi:hypothetical protein